MGGGKGSKTTTTTQVNPMQQLQMPYVQQGWETAKQLYDRQSQYPGSTIADWGLPWMKEGLNNIYATGQTLDQTLRPQANAYWQQGGEGSVYNSPAYNYFQNMAANATVPQQAGFAQLHNAALHSLGEYYSPIISGYANPLGSNNNLGMTQLGQTAQGNYLNGNPWFSQMVQNALDPITRNFQTATAPQLDASFANSGRYGSGAMLGQRENAQNVLADQLAKTSSNMYGQNYANERQQQLAAANQYGQLYNQGLTGAAAIQQGAANTYQQGLQQAMAGLAPQLNAMLAGAQGLQGGYQAGNASALQAAQLYPQLSQAQFANARAALEAGQGLNQIQQQYIDEPYNMLDRYLKQIGAVQGGSSTTTSPYFTNPLANAMAGITGGMDIMQKMGGMGGLGGSSMGGYPATVSSPSGTWVNGTGMGSGIYTNMSNGITSDQSGSGFPGIGQMAGMAGQAAKKI